MYKRYVSFQKASFTYDSLANQLIADLTADFPIGWTGIVGSNGSGKSTLLKLATGELHPASGSVHIPGMAIYCPQRTDDPPVGLDDLLQTKEKYAFQIIDQLGLASDWNARWQTLSHGERKRAQIAVALWAKPHVLAIDEPTNHIDNDARQMLISSLQNYRGVGLLVSHDRELLDMLCNQCFFMEHGEAIMRQGNYSHAATQAEQDVASQRRQREIAKNKYLQLKATAVKRRSVAAQADKRRSKSHLDKKDHDGRAKANLALLTGKDAVAGKLSRQMEARLQRASEEEQAIKIKKTYKLGIWLEGSRSKRDFLFRLPAGKIPLGETKSLDFPNIMMRPADRTAIMGPNGAGKSTFIHYILNRLYIHPERLIYVPQEIDLATTRYIMDEVHNLKYDRLGHVMTVVSCLGSRPEWLLESREPSPGEMRKILLALGISLNPHLIIMDEPTNHMDLPSIKCLEDALAGCPCGLLMVSHDRFFLDRLVDIHWHIVTNEMGNSSLIVQP